MSSLLTIGAAGAGMGLVDFISGQRQNDSVLNTSTALAQSEQMLSNHKKAQNAYGGSSEGSTAAQEALQRALEELGLNERSVTLAELKRYQSELEQKFSSDLRKDLAKLGVEADTAFSLSISAEGAIQVNCADALAKQKIEKYLEENPKAVEQFSYIQALSNFGRAQQSPAGSNASWQAFKNSGASLTADYLDSLFKEALQSGMQYSSVLADFSGDDGAASYYTGLNYKI